jgi:hypothetical protein
MRNGFAVLAAGLTVCFVLSPVARSQDLPPRGAVDQRPPSVYQKMQNAGPGGPAPVHDLNGSWAGPLEPQLGTASELTALGKKLMAMNIPDPFSAKSNDPWATCDPYGMPRSTTNETRGIDFATMPGRIVIMTQYQKIWREVWMDGRELPKGFGTKDGPDPRWYGYSIGHWDGDSTLVVETTGMNATSWVDRRGYPHSTEAVTEERYVRPDHNDLQLSVTLTDPKMYTKPWVISTNKFKWIPDQQDDEQMCVPSEAILYRNAVAFPADQDDAVSKEKPKK